MLKACPGNAHAVGPLHREEIVFDSQKCPLCAEVKRADAADAECAQLEHEIRDLANKLAATRARLAATENATETVSAVPAAQ